VRLRQCSESVVMRSCVECVSEMQLIGVDRPIEV